MPSFVRSVPATFTGTFPPTRFQMSNVPPLAFFFAIASRSTMACPVTLPFPIMVMRGSLTPAGSSGFAL